MSKVNFTSRVKGMIMVLVAVASVLLCGVGLRCMLKSQLRSYDDSKADGAIAINKERMLERKRAAEQHVDKLAFKKKSLHHVRHAVPPKEKKQKVKATESGVSSVDSYKARKAKSG